MSPFQPDVRTLQADYGIFVRWFEGTVLTRVTEPRLWGLLRPRYVVVYDFDDLSGPFAIVEDVLRWSKAEKGTAWWVLFESKDKGETWRPSKGKYGMPPYPDDEPRAA